MCVCVCVCACVCDGWVLGKRRVSDGRLLGEWWIGRLVHQLRPHGYTCAAHPRALTRTHAPVPFRRTSGARP